MYYIVFLLSILCYYVFCFKKFKIEDIKDLELEYNSKNEIFDIKNHNLKLNIKLFIEIILSSIAIVLCFYAFMSI